MNTYADKPRLLITGANGFVGRALRLMLHKRGYVVRAAVRSNPSSIDEIAVGNIDQYTDWTAALQNIEVVVHLAARVHLLADTAIDPLTEFRKVNFEGTSQLARQAIRAGVKRIIFVSSTKVNGDSTQPGEKFVENISPIPPSPYGISKWEAEQFLNTLHNNLEVVIVRPPLVYGPNVRGNMYRLLTLVDRGLPLPFAHTTNRRSLIGVDNLADFIIRCIEAPAAAHQTFLVSDNNDLSTTQLVCLLADTLNRPARLFFAPEAPIRLAAKIIGKKSMFDQLWGSLVVDSSKAMQCLNWSPPYTVSEGVKKMAQAYLEAGKK